MTNGFYVPINFEWTQNIHRRPKNRPRTIRIYGEPHHTKGHMHQLGRFLTVFQNHRACPQVDRRWLANFCFMCTVCLASASQVMRKLHAGVRRSRNGRQFSHVYLTCIAGVSQVCCNPLATLSKVDEYACNWVRTCFSNLILLGKWLSCNSNGKIVELESSFPTFSNI